MAAGMARNSSCPAVRSCAPTARGAPSARTAPPSSTTARSERGSASSSRCSESSTVVPSSRLTRASAARKSAAAMGSSCAVGSSKMSTSGCRVSTAARFKSCFCPPESDAASLWNQLSMPKKPAISATRRRMVGVSYPRLSGPKASSCQTLSVTIWFSGLCCTKPMRSACSRGETSESRRPAKRTAPERTPLGASAVFSWRRSVLLPLPESPQSVTNSPAQSVRLTSRRAGADCPG